MGSISIYHGGRRSIEIYGRVIGSLRHRTHIAKLLVGLRRAWRCVMAYLEISELKINSIVRFAKNNGISNPNGRLG
jgi:hypothetical protein